MDDSKKVVCTACGREEGVEEGWCPVCGACQTQPKDYYEAFRLIEEAFDN